MFWTIIHDINCPSDHCNFPDWCGDLGYSLFDCSCTPRPNAVLSVRHKVKFDELPSMQNKIIFRVNLVCHTDWSGMIIPFGFDLFLMIVCTYYAVMTRYIR